MAAAVVITLLSVVSPACIAAPAPVSPHASIGPSCPTDATSQTISLVHVADLHANFDPAEDKYGRIRAYYKQVRTANPYTIFTNGGDDYEKGSLAELRSSGLAVFEVTQAMQFDVRTLGNHEFAWGEANVLRHSRDPYSLVVLSNTTYTGSDPQGLGSVEFGVLDVGCLKVGFLGLLSPPWDETDNAQYVDYFPTFATRYDYANVVQQIVDDRRSQVDVLVLVSHLGVIGDRSIAAQVTGIDLILGGHTHGGPSYETIGQTRVVQPDFYADGVTRIDVDVDLATRQINTVQRTETPVSQLVDTDAGIHALTADLVVTDAPEAHLPVGYLESAASSTRILEIAGDAGLARFQADAALLSPAVVNVFRPWPAGELTPQEILYFYWVERQPPNTPGISAQYIVEVSGATLSAMRTAQPGWTYRGPDPVIAGQQYKVVVNKGAALQPAFYFTGFAGYASVTFGAETWEVIRDYGALRTSQCKYIDSDGVIPACRTATSSTTWTFQNASAPLDADAGSALLGYFDPGFSDWAAGKVAFAAPSAFGIVSPRASASRVMSLAPLSPSEGLTITHTESANGGFLGQGLVSDYTLIIDALWPSASDNKWRSLLQTNPANTDDGDWFVQEAPSGGIGTNGQFFGSVPPDAWHRLAVVANVAPSNGTLRYYIDGAPVGEASDAGQRWALGQLFLLFADESNESEQVYVAGIRFAAYALSATDIQNLGGPQNPLGSAVNGGPPSAPIIGVADPGPGQASIGFSPPSSIGGGAIFRYTATCVPSGGGTTVTHDATSSPIGVTGLVNGTTYGCSVTATNNLGTGPASASVLVMPAKDNQTIQFGATPSIALGGTGTVTATATSGMAVVLSSTTVTCSISGTTVTGLAAGTCTIAANQAGDANYNAAPQVTQSFAVGKGSQTIAFGAAPSVVVGGTGTVSATGGASGNPVVFSSTTTGVCTTSGTNGTTVTILAAGICTIAANQAGSVDYLAALQVTQSFTVTGIFRAYLSKNGSDANPCTLPQPCRLLPAALRVVNEGGEIWMLDSANFNVVTVNVFKSVTILAAPGALGSVVANGADAIQMSGTPTLEVTLRNLVVLNLSGAGNTGIRFIQGSQLTVEGSEIYGVATGVVASAAGGLLTVKDTTIRDTVNAGVELQGSVLASLDRVALLNNGSAGINVLGGAQGQVSGSTISGSATGASVTATGSTAARLTLSATELSGNGTALAVSAAAGADTAQSVLEDVTITHNATGVALSGAGTKTVFSRQNNTLKFNTNDVTGGTLTPQAAF